MFMEKEDKKSEKNNWFEENPSDQEVDQEADQGSDHDAEEETDEEPENEAENEPEQADIIAEEDLATWDFLEKEHSEIKNDLKSIQFREKISMVTNPQPLNLVLDNSIQDDFHDEYDFNKGRIIDKFELNIGSKTIPRFSCASHKLNLVIRRAIARHPDLSRILRTLANSNTHIRKSIELNRVFRKKKCRLRLENLTRWSSAYLMLESVKRAYDRGIVYI
jgi:hypothetical protein